MIKVKTYKLVGASVLFLVAMVLLFPKKIASSIQDADSSVRGFIALNFYEGEEAERIVPLSRYRCIFPARGSEDQDYENKIRY
ncbi:MAG: Uncharacterised protein [Marinobacterium sp. xm-d-530]|jgi:hypothetical protein|nr:MAG: Uncharacterised protein [Marinobacterium sp. xm-d-530]